MLDEQLWNSLARTSGQQPTWVHGCTLEHGHAGEHRALAYRAGPHLHWVHWDDRRQPRLSVAVDTPPPRTVHPLIHPRDRRQTAAPPISRQPTSAHDRMIPPTSQADALWAIAAALERLADVIAALNPTEQEGRHRRRNATNDN
jgi:hypothetical protein